MIEDELDALDRAIAAGAVPPIWIGSEPTFTDARSLEAEWNGAALGPTKEARARALVARMAARRPHCVVLRSVGRQYGGEERPRWSYGLWARRDARAVWRGPRDPLAGGAIITSEADARDACERARDALAEVLASEGAAVACFEGERDLRLVARRDGRMPEGADPRLLAPSLHDVRTPEGGLYDPLARAGTWLVRVRAIALESGFAVRLELPELTRVEEFEWLLSRLERALAAATTPALILAGHPPPADASIAYCTVTPDPAVIEVNAAPHASARAFFDDARDWHEVAREEGLSARRLFYDGDEGDSGGGGQITIGGPSSDESPFFTAPALLPKLVAFGARHPSLSYLFAVDNVGPWSQSPRPDEGLRASFVELRLAMHTLARAAHAPFDRARLQDTLGPFLRDATGNAHRAEFNVEKLWNGDLPQRGRLGLVELRAFRMARSPARAAAFGALVRALVAFLARHDVELALPDWGDELHDRWLLPTFLARDLDDVLAALRSGGLGLGASLEGELRAVAAERRLGVVDDGRTRVAVARALEIWPLLGDAGSQEQRAARWIDASTRRIELRVEGALAGLHVAVNGHPIALRGLDDELAVRGIRHRAFLPARGLHPSIAAQAPLRIRWWREGETRARELTLHDWKPDGGGYDGLPCDDEEARRRREARFVVREVAIDDRALGAPPPADAWTIDLRALG